jgi:hypothetical protein
MSAKSRSPSENSIEPHTPQLTSALNLFSPLCTPVRRSQFFSILLFHILSWCCSHIFFGATFAIILIVYDMRTIYVIGVCALRAAHLHKLGYMNEVPKHALRLYFNFYLSSPVAHSNTFVEITLSFFY